MADIEKVIKGLECCSAHKANRCDSKTCPYWESEVCCIDEMLDDAHTLLKEQEKENSRIANEYLNLVKVASKQPQIVRCKDCKWYEPTPDKDEPDRGWCSGKCNSLCAVHDDWFCADGERKET